MPPRMCRGKVQRLANRYRYHYLKLQAQVTLFEGVVLLLA